MTKEISDRSRCFGTFNSLLTRWVTYLFRENAMLLKDLVVLKSIISGWIVPVGRTVVLLV